MAGMRRSLGVFLLSLASTSWLGGSPAIAQQPTTPDAVAAAVAANPAHASLIVANAVIANPDAAAEIARAAAAAVPDAAKGSELPDCDVNDRRGDVNGRRGDVNDRKGDPEYARRGDRACFCDPRATRSVVAQIARAAAAAAPAAAPQIAKAVATVVPKAAPLIAVSVVCAVPTAAAAVVAAVVAIVPGRATEVIAAIVGAVPDLPSTIYQSAIIGQEGPRTPTPTATSMPSSLGRDKQVCASAPCS